MIKNYLKVAMRNLWRNKAFSAINIIGLAIALSICLLITLFVIDEFSFDKYNANAGRIYRVNSDWRVNGTSFNYYGAPAPMAAGLRRDYPQIEQATRILYFAKTAVKNKNETFFEPSSCYADANLFKVFTISMIAGDENTALKQPNSLVVNEDVARRYFNSTDVIGKTLIIDSTQSYKITGVIKNMPPQSHIHLGLIRSMSGYAASTSTSYTSPSYLTYLLLRPHISQAILDSYLAETARKYTQPEVARYLHLTLSQMDKEGDHILFNSIPLTKIHLYSTLPRELEPSGNIQYVYIFLIIAVVILLMACVNFMNLSTARSSGRSKEVGVRKVLGSSRSALVWQFLIESTITSFIALGIGLLITILLFPFLNNLSGKQIDLGLFTTIWLLPALVLISALVGVMAGIYPAFFLSAFQPIQVLKGKLASGFKGSILRNSLVIFQFAAVIVLIIGTLVIFGQLNYIRNKNLGYNRDHVLILQNTSLLGSHALAFKQEALKIDGVENATMTDFLPTSNKDRFDVYSRDATMGLNPIQIKSWDVDEGYIPTLGMQILKGRNFSNTVLSDSTAVVINETAAAMIGIKEPLNQRLYNKPNATAVACNIIGIVKDFNASSLHKKIEPMVLRLSHDPQRTSAAFRIRSNNIPALISRIESLYHSVDNSMNGQPFQYSFMDEEFNRIYQSDQNTGRIFTSFAFFAIFIACLGLFGLITYSAEQRVKEIGIRKVLGASITNIITMLSGDYLKLIGIAAIISFPIAWWVMHKWLQDFAYRISINWGVFLLAGTIALLIAIVTISLQSIKAATANPAKSLRSE